MKKEILRMQDVCAGDYEPYGLDHFRLHLCEGEMAALIGLSGSGKTMVYEFFLGNVPIREGKVTYSGKTYRTGECFGQVTEVACIGRASTLIPSLSIAENIFIITGKRKMKGLVHMRNIYYRASLLLSQYAPKLSAHTKISELTPVEKRMVELLRAIENEVKLVVIDDVFQGYGQSDILGLMELLKTMKEKRISILYESHEVDFTKKLLDKVLVIRKGKNIRTFYEKDYDEQLCRKLLIGNETLPEFERSSVSRERIVFQARNISGKDGVREFQFQVHAGEIVGLYDLNNRKNMEVLQMIMGEKPLIGGVMHLREHQYEPKNLDYAIRSNIGFIPRNMSQVSLAESMSFMDNLYLPVLKKTSHFKIFRNRQVADFLGREYMESLGIPFGEKNQKVKYFDAYIQNSILLTRWVLFKPTLMVCMEPCGEADLIMRDIIFKALSEMAENQTGVLIASQNLNELKIICDTIYVLNDEECFRIEK